MTMADRRMQDKNSVGPKNKQINDSHQQNCSNSNRSSRSLADIHHVRKCSERWGMFHSYKHMIRLLSIRHSNMCSYHPYTPRLLYIQRIRDVNSRLKKGGLKEMEAFLAGPKKSRPK